MMLPEPVASMVWFALLVLGPMQPTEPPAGQVLYVYDLHRDPISMPQEMAQDVTAVWLDCEVRGWWSRWETPADVVSETEDYGQAALNIIHAPSMAREGLNFWDEHDRIVWAIRMYERSQWAPWGCRP